MPSPSGIFYNAVKSGALTVAQLQTIQNNLIERGVFGDVTGESGGGKSESRSYGMTAQQGLIEANYAIQRLNGTLQPNRVQQVLAPRQYGQYSGF